MFWKSDRWGRSAAHVLITIGELRGRGVTVKSLTENFDLDTKEGRFMFAVLAAAAEYKLKLRAERQAEASPPRGERHRRGMARMGILLPLGVVPPGPGCRGPALLVPAGRLLAGRWREAGRNWDPVRSWASTT